MVPMHITDLPERSQDYLKTIYDRQEWDGGAASLSDLAAALGQRRSTASEAIKRLVGAGLVDHAPYGDVTLTEQGHRLAVQLVRRHRLIESFLVQYLGYRLDEVHDEAEVLEHAVSDTFVERIDAALGRPQRDPHGDPIPGVDGHVDEPGAVALSSVPPGASAVVERVRDRDPALLRYLSDHGVLPGARVEVLPPPYPGMALLRVGRDEVSVSAAALESILALR